MSEPKAGRYEVMRIPLKNVLRQRWYKPHTWGAFTRKRAVTLIVDKQTGRAVFTPDNYSKLAKEGYEKCVYVYRSVNVITNAAAQVKPLLFDVAPDGTETEIRQHPILDLLARPNELMGGPDFTRNVFGYFKLSGNSFIHACRPTTGDPIGNRQGRPPMELWPLRPDKTKVIPGDAINPVRGFQFGEESKVPPLPKEDVLHLKSFHPLDDFYGLSPIRVSATSVDHSNEAQRWNVSLLQNEARPSGAYVVEGNLTDEQFDRLKEELRAQFQGGDNPGNPLLLEGGAKWQELSLSPSDMDWLEGMNLDGKLIALVFDVPPEMLGDAKNKTFANYKEARKSFYEDTILPLNDWYYGELNNWLVPMYGNDRLQLRPDRESLPALQEDRNAQWERLDKSTELTINEKRRAKGFDEHEDGDVILVPINLVPLSAVAGGGLDESPDDSEVEVDDDESDDDGKFRFDPAHFRLNPGRYKEAAKAVLKGNGNGKGKKKCPERFERASNV